MLIIGARFSTASRNKLPMIGVEIEPDKKRCHSNKIIFSKKYANTIASWIRDCFLIEGSVIRKVVITFNWIIFYLSSNHLALSQIITSLQGPIRYLKITDSILLLLFLLWVLNMYFDNTVLTLFLYVQCIKYWFY